MGVVIALISGIIGVCAATIGHRAVVDTEKPVATACHRTVAAAGKIAIRLILKDGARIKDIVAPAMKARFDAEDGIP